MQDLQSYFSHGFEQILPGATESQIQNAERYFKIEFPKEYRDAMKLFNGGEGDIGPNSWLCLFPIYELIEINKVYDFLLCDIPDYILIGKDAADGGFAIRKFDMTFHEFGLMSNFKTDPITLMGKSFTGFLDYLYNAP